MKKILAGVVGVGLLCSGAGVAWAATAGDSGGSPTLAASSTALIARSGRARPGLVKIALQAAADAIHIDRATLVKELRTGKTIADVAREHHVAPDTVVDAIVKAATDKINALVGAGKLDAAKAKKVEDRLPQLAQRLVDGKLPGAGRPGVAGRAVRGALDVAADTIHVDRSALVQELRSGKSIADVAREHHVDPQAVIDAIVDAAKQKLSTLQANGKLSADRLQKLEQRLPALAERFVNRKLDDRLGGRRGATAVQPAGLAA